MKLTTQIHISVEVKNELIYASTVPYVFRRYKGTVLPFYLFAHSDKKFRFKTNFAELFKHAYRKKNLLVVSCGIGYTKSPLKSTNFIWTFFLCGTLFFKWRRNNIWMVNSSILFGAFSKLRKASTSFIISVCVSDRPHGTLRLLLDGFFSKNCWEI
jgi:hypothetical protein